jgi:hypothetical protein
MYPDFKELLSLFNEHKVKYLVVGGYAVSLEHSPLVHAWQSTIAGTITLIPKSPSLFSL